MSFETNIDFEKLEIIKRLGKGKSGISSLIKINNSFFVLKTFHTEEAPYYSFNNGKKLDFELWSYNKLKEFAIPIPKLFYVDKERNFIIKEFIDGKTGSEIIAEGKVNLNILYQIFLISMKLKKYFYNADYFPSNFVITSDFNVYYIDYELNPYSSDWSFENWGIYYWANEKGFKSFLLTGDAKFINSSIERGVPHKAEFENTIKNWLFQLNSLYI